MSFKGSPQVNYYTSPRFEVSFSRIGSQRFEQMENDLLAYKIPITKIIKRHIVNNIQEIEDRIGLTQFESAVQSLQEDANSLVFGADYAVTTAFTAFNVAAGTVLELGKVKSIDVIQGNAAIGAAASCGEDLRFPVQKDDFIKLGKLFPGTGGARNGRLKCNQLLITDTDLLDVNSWTNSDVGEKIAGETAVKGWKYDTIVGMKYIRTLKTDLLRPGNVYGFTESDYLGGFLILNKTKFYADKERDKISFEAWEDVGIYVANVAAIRKLEMYAGSVETVTGLAPGAETDTHVALRAKFLPFAEEDLGQLNNLIAEGITHPAISQF
tara:strand:- start:105 stop:1079 length:975 start_codon:yes stop_codon:yes gene_type:complete